MSGLAAHWQTLVAAAIAAGCAGWVGWRLLRPFIGRVASACGGGCGGDGAGVENGAAGAADDLIQITPVAARRN